MNNDMEIFYTILMVYAIPAVILLLAGIVVIVIGYGKEKKTLKLAGIVITAIGIQIVAIMGALALYFKFLVSSMPTYN